MRAAGRAASLAACIMLAACTAQPNADIVAACDDGRIDASRVLGVWEARGVVRGVDRRPARAAIEVDAMLWRRLETRAQISIAVAVLCQVKDAAGRATVTVRSGADADLGGVVDGHWSR